MNNKRDISLLVVVHTEEEFDWNKPFSSENAGVTHVPGLRRVQDVFDRHGVKATWMLGYPIVSNEESAAVFRDFVAQSGVEIGCHIHPWVTPPIDPAYDPSESYHGNHPRDLEYAKIKTCTEAIKEKIGIQPLSFLGGRYSFGPNTGAILEELGYQVDMSIKATGYYAMDGGPDYRRVSLKAHWNSPGNGLLRIPGTGAYLGPLRFLGPWLSPLMAPKLVKQLRAEGILSHAGLFETLQLSPEGYSLKDMIKLTDAVIKQGEETLLLGFHSPSVMRNGTPYVKTHEDVEEFIDKIDQYLSYVTALGGVVPRTASDYRAYFVAGESRL
ncbi:polysaccharide deacetylase family protein [Magnetospira sp. QH-2]|uniref:polysaccharide deacetylase family protein n=1 Tax=Magnetospira sp. (strain QH-2) TaxID=1288970 RepID=UPI00130E32FC|nr:polysaccharide deacetylase family protein [Magnetospira sp. QH-2]